MRRNENGGSDNGSGAGIGQLTLHFIPPPQPLNWSTPSGVLRSILQNYVIQKVSPPEHYIGHVNVEIETAGGERFITGQTSDKDSSYEIKVLSNQMGLHELLFAPQAGRLFAAEVIEGELELRRKRGTLASVRFLVKGETCDLLLDFLKSYIEHGQHKKFAGITGDPLHGEPAGCSSFAMAFLEIAGLLDAEMRQAWRRELLLPKKMIKKETAPSFWSLIVMDQWDWAHEGEPDLERVWIWDPQLMFEWVQQVWDGERDYPGGVERRRAGEARMLQFDRTSVKPCAGLSPGQRHYLAHDLQLFDSAQPSRTQAGQNAQNPPS